jgi:uncharacterized protein YggE
MHRRELLLGGGTALTLALGGCLGSAQESDDETDAGETARTITVRKTGRAEAEPDLAVLRVGVEATGDSAESVRSDLAKRSADVREALVEFGIDEAAITTGQFDIRQRTDERPGPREPVESESDTRREISFEGTHTLTVEIDDVESTGAVIDTAVEAGADRVDGIEFTLTEETRERLRKEALEEAIADARAEAEFVTGELDASLLEARRVDASGGDVSPVREHVTADAAAESAGPPTELHPDDVTVRATVVVEYEME